MLAEAGCPRTTPGAGSRSRTCGVSLENLEAILDYCADHDIRMYRMATSLAPYASHPTCRSSTARSRSARRSSRRQAPGARLGIRLSTHPGQYTVLNSEDARCVAAASPSWRCRPR